MKKFLFLFLLLGLYNLSYATITLPQYEYLAGETLEVQCDTGTNLFIYTKNGQLYGAGNCPVSTNIDNVNDYVLVECSGECGETLSGARLSEFYISEVSLKILPSEQTTSAIPKSIFYSRDPETEKSTANNLVAMAGGATSTTIETMGGIVGLIGGIIAGFGVIMYIISLLNETKTKKKDHI